MSRNPMMHNLSYEEARLIYKCLSMFWYGCSNWTQEDLDKLSINELLKFKSEERMAGDLMARLEYAAGPEEQA